MRVLVMWLHAIQQSWARFWQMVGAEGDYPRSLAQWKVRYSAGKP